MMSHTVFYTCPICTFTRTSHTPVPAPAHLHTPAFIPITCYTPSHAFLHLVTHLTHTCLLAHLIIWVLYRLMLLFFLPYIFSSFPFVAFFSAVAFINSTGVPFHLSSHLSFCVYLISMLINIRCVFSSPCLLFFFS